MQQSLGQLGYAVRFPATLGRRAAGSWAAALAAQLERERSRWILWLPVLLGSGVAGYFALPAQPRPWAGWLAAAVATVLALAARRRPFQPLRLAEALLLGAAGVAMGFFLAQARLAEVAAPILERPGTYRVEGRILDLAPFPEGAKVLLGELRMERVPPERTPVTVRVNLRRDVAVLAPGDRIALLARLQPPMAPALPGAFDFARQAYFEQLGAVGFAIGKAERLSAREDRLGLMLARLRAIVAARILEISPGDAGAMAAALIAGVRAGIDQETWHAMQVSGLAHLISVSGLHMVLVAGSVFTACRWLLALIPALALRFPVKRLAAFVALLAAAFYLGLSGASIPTQRAFLMTAIGLIAIMADRNPFSIRLLAWSALAVLLVRPESVLGASFQLSFAAVLGLIAIYEAWRQPDPDRDAPSPRLAGARRYLAGVCLTTLIASGATTPFAAFHFQTIPTYGVVANLVAVPLTSFIVMPAGLIGMLLLPLGWDGPAFALMALGVEGVLLTARAVAELPGALVRVTQWPMAGLALLAAGGLWLALWQQAWRWLGLVPCLLAVLAVAFSRPPDLLVDDRLGMAALRRPDASVALIEWQRDRLVRDTWLRHLGQAAAEPAPRPGAGPDRGIACDLEGCVVDLGGRRVALAHEAAASRVDCQRADLVITRAGPERCPGGANLIGPAALRDSGGMALYDDGAALRVRTVAAARGAWPWSNDRRSRSR